LDCSVGYPQDILVARLVDSRDSSEGLSERGNADRVSVWLVSHKLLRAVGCHRCVSVGLALLLCAIGFLSHGAYAEADCDSYIPPENLFAAALHQTITLPERIDINRSSLNQLKILPGFDEDLALKILRYRPFQDIQDLYRKMPRIDRKHLQRLIEQIQPHIRFN
jgi:hypothetical protein